LTSVDTGSHSSSLLLEFELFETLGYFPGSFEDVPKVAVDRVRTALGVSLRLTPDA
jgi:hypothetical protein